VPPVRLLVDVADFLFHESGSGGAQRAGGDGAVAGAEVRGRSASPPLRIAMAWGRLVLLAAGPARDDQRNFGPVTHSLHPTRARGAPAREENKATSNYRPCSTLSTKSPIPKNVYASAIGLCKDSMIMQSTKPSNSDFWRSFNI